MSSSEANEMTAEIVAEYLRDHPDFFVQRKELVEHLSLPVRQEGAISLVEIQMKRQRERIAELEEEITELMSLATSNGQNFHQFMDLQDSILKSDSLVQAITLIEQFASELSLKAYIKLVNNHEPDLAISSDDWQRFATNHFNGKPAYLGRLRQSDRQLLFGNDIGPELGSFVVLPLQKTKPLGIIAFSSEDGGHFQPNMDTLFLRHLAVVVSHFVSATEWNRESESNVLSHTSA